MRTHEQIVDAVKNGEDLTDEKEVWMFYEAIGDLDGMHRMAFPDCPIQNAHCHGDDEN